VWHWDTFDNEDIEIKGEFKTLPEALAFARSHYGERLRPNGADRVFIKDGEGHKSNYQNVG
jgi:hypothetical protein